MPGRQAHHERPVAHIATHQPRGRAHLAVEIVEPAVAVEGVVKAERGDLGAGLDQRLDQMRTDKSIGAGDQHLLSLVAVRLCHRRQNRRCPCHVAPHYAPPRSVMLTPLAQTPRASVRSIADQDDVQPRG